MIRPLVLVPVNDMIQAYDELIMTKFYMDNPGKLFQLLDYDKKKVDRWT